MKATVWNATMRLLAIEIRTNWFWSNAFAEPFLMLHSAPVLHVADKREVMQRFT
jgi:hypothetical protein